MTAPTTAAPPQAPTRHAEVHYLRREAPLEPPVQVPRAQPLSVSAQARLLFWREMSGRWPLYLLLSLSVLIALLAPERWIDEATYLVFMSMLPFAVAQGLGPAVREEGFWAGLGGPAWLREVVPMATTLLALTVAAVLTANGGIVWAVSVGLFAVVGVMRGWAATSAGRLLGAVALVIIASCTTITTWTLGIWTVPLGLVARLVALIGVCLVARPLWAHRRPAAAAGRKRGRGRWLAIGLLPALVGLVEVLWPVPVGGELNFGKTLLVPTGSDPMVSPQVVWRVDGVAPARTGLRGPVDSAGLHASGAIFYEVTDSNGTVSVGLYSPHGEKVECVLPGEAGSDPSGFSWVAEDGRSMVSSTVDGTFLSVGVDEGCGVGSAPSGLPSLLVSQPVPGRTFVATDDWSWVEVHKDDGSEPYGFSLLNEPPESR